MRNILWNLGEVEVPWYMLSIESAARSRLNAINILAVCLLIRVSYAWFLFIRIKDIYWSSSWDFCRNRCVHQIWLATGSCSVFWLDCSYVVHPSIARSTLREVYMVRIWRGILNQEKMHCIPRRTVSCCWAYIINCLWGGKRCWRNAHFKERRRGASVILGYQWLNKIDDGIIRF